MNRRIMVNVDETTDTVTITFVLYLQQSTLELQRKMSLPLTEEKVSRLLSQLKDAFLLDDKVVETLSQVGELTSQPEGETQAGRKPQPTLPFEPPKSPQTFDVIITKLKELYPQVPSEVIDRVIGMVADKCEIPRERFFKLSSDEFERLNNALFSPVGEDGVRHVLLIETIVRGNYEVPTNQDERKALLVQAREFVRNHPILSQCQENVNQVRIDGWRGAFLALYEIYRIEK